MKANKSFAAIILAAGQGRRMKSDRPKAMHEIAGQAMLGHVMQTAQAAGVGHIIVVTAPKQDDVRTLAIHLDAKAQCATQTEPLGTGDAVRAALPLLKGLGKSGRVVVMFGDTPLIPPSVIDALLTAKAPLAVLGFTPDDTAAYGRIVLENSQPIVIIEHKDATADQRKIKLCNGGAMAIDAVLLPDLLEQLSNDNAQGEYYLPDLVQLAVAAGHSTALVKSTSENVMGVDSQAALAQAEEIYQNRLRQKFMDAGVTLIAPETIYFSHDTQIEKNVIIEPHCFFGTNVSIASGARIKSFSHIDNAIIGRNAQIGPYARLRPGTVLEADVKIGNFVETKQAHIEMGAKVNHLSYIGDAHIGAKANIGAGVITCNYDGFNKHKTEIGVEVFVGSNTSLIAPIKIADGAYIGSSSALSERCRKRCFGCYPCAFALDKRLGGEVPHPSQKGKKIICAALSALLAKNKSRQ